MQGSFGFHSTAAERPWSRLNTDRGKRQIQRLLLLVLARHFGTQFVAVARDGRTLGACPDPLPLGIFFR